MSTGLECSFLQVKPDEWFYLLEDGGAPKDAWDWREYATAYGPFPTYDVAHEHLHDNHANPGGHSIRELAKDESEANLDALTAGLVAKAREASRDRGRRHVWHPRY